MQKFQLIIKLRGLFSIKSQFIMLFSNDLKIISFKDFCKFFFLIK